MTGTLCLPVAFPPKDYTPAQSLIDKLRPFQFTKRITQYFCPTCGTHMLGRCLEDGDKPDREGYWFLMTGTLKQADGVFDVRAHIFIEDTLDGLSSAGRVVVIKESSCRGGGGHQQYVK
ncbi:hypothetical protein LTR36_008222 [Oleoguttula mirabilis]|uniref:CENP-V/GFA domain-containing protein n=1 Tax=Oleoguttula mirabilis TaxID=1507867 RepID=A0AAV9J7Y8_9PEZI|nr:hypothetical protein LTR36_008222 [Oleoguttula mirabilis]